ncbi:MAG: prolyl oligopeptidase family serine peptidase [Pirellulales bacterium]
MTYSVSRCLLSLLLGCMPLGFGWADGPADNHPANVRPVPPPGIVLTTARQQGLRDAVSHIRREVASIKELPETDAHQILVLARAIEMTIDHSMFYSDAEVAMADKVNDLALQRITAAKEGKRGMALLGVQENSDKQQWIVGGFRSKLDGSLQPFGIVVPPQWKSDKPLRMDVWLHGRDEKTSEVGFLHRRMTQAGEFTPAETIVLHPYGRYSNAFKFAGEIDVLEAMQHLQSQFPIDTNRVAIRGFSMGGAGCWQMAVHYPGTWFAATPGAGFAETTEFLRVFQSEKFEPTATQKALLHWYDCPDWSNNFQHHPLIVYSGELDRQKQAADIMEQSLKSKGMAMMHIIGPKTEHKFHPDSKVLIEKQVQEWAVRGRDRNPDRIDFTTYTLRYASDGWLTLKKLQRHWEEARVQAERKPGSLRIQTKNVRRLGIDMEVPEQMRSQAWKLEIDGGSPMNVAVTADGKIQGEWELEGSQWKAKQGTKGSLEKRPGLQGPIDDAFLSSFVFVPPQGNATTPVDQWVAKEYAHAATEWRRHFRGDIVAKAAKDVLDQDIADSNLILFGTPETNPLLAKIVGKLPVQWSEDSVEIAGVKQPRNRHVVAMIYPNPLNPNRYVVINSGFTYREYAYLNNARQIPMLPDWALLNVEQGATSQMPGKVVADGFFGENWE